MLSKSTQKYIQSLHHKKNRQEEGLFLVEGAKNVQELLNADFDIKALYVTNDFWAKNRLLAQKYSFVEIIDEKDLEKLGTFQSNNAALAVVKMKDNKPLNAEENEWVLVLDDIRDPGNMGTIIRIADWYGIKKLICSPECVEVYNPKVVAATMGSFTRVEVFLSDLLAFFEQNKENKPVLGAFLSGQNIHQFTFPSSGYIVVGNESHGISKHVEAFISHKISIPNFGGAESLNAGIATAVVLDNWRRFFVRGE